MSVGPVAGGLVVRVRSPRSGAGPRPASGIPESLDLPPGRHDRRSVMRLLAKLLQRSAGPSTMPHSAPSLARQVSISLSLLMRGSDIQGAASHAAHDQICHAHGLDSAGVHPGFCMRRRSITASMRAMIRSESAITLLLLAELSPSRTDTARLPPRSRHMDPMISRCGSFELIHIGRQRSDHVGGSRWSCEPL